MLAIGMELTQRIQDFETWDRNLQRLWYPGGHRQYDELMEREVIGQRVILPNAIYSSK